MTVEVEDIRSWVDGELDDAMSDQIRQTVVSDVSLQKTANKLRASQLPYREAYKQVQMPDVPQSLRETIAELQHSVTPDANIKTVDIQNAPTETPKKSSFKMIGIAASVMLAGLIGFLSGTNTSTQLPSSVSVNTPMQSDSFAQTVAAYQQFYVRETLTGAVPPNPAKVTERLTSQTDMQVIIPEFEGYEFMRAQRLSIDGELLLQLVYLGAEGGPLALCYTVSHEADVESVPGNGAGTTKLAQHHGLNTAEWRHKGHQFVIVSDAAEEKLDELSQITKQRWNS